MGEVLYRLETLLLSPLNGLKKVPAVFRMESIFDLSGDEGALPPARVLMIRFTWTLSLTASFTIFSVSSIISGPSMPLATLSNGKDFAQDSF